MKIYSASQISLADSYTISHEPISSIDLMERASQAFVEELFHAFPHAYEFHIFCGTGNNGGDALAIARILCKRHKNVNVYLLQQAGQSGSRDYATNLERLKACVSPLYHCTIQNFSTNISIQASEHAIIIDGIFGIGLNKPVEGTYKDAIACINALPNTKIAIDIPSGLYADIPTTTNQCICKVDLTITFAYPKLMFLFAEHENYIGNWVVINIGLLKEFEKQEPTPYTFILAQDIHLQQRASFSHKGTYGHALIIAGSKGKIGAAILTSKSCIQSGCGLVTSHIPEHANVILQTAVPEVMTSCDNELNYITTFPSTQTYSAIAIGPGLGTHSKIRDGFKLFLESNKKPLVLDADALNILANNKELLSLLPHNTILTPHPGEFDRLTQPHSHTYERFCSQVAFAKQTNCIVVLKGKYTSIVLPSGEAYFNSSGNPGMATAGSGDVLTGIIVSLLCQGYSPDNAATYGVYIHGLAGDIALKNQSLETLTASEIIANLASAFITLHT